MSEHVLLAIDAGGTRTRCAIATSEGRLLGFGSGGPANHILSGWEQARASLAEAIGAALASAGQPQLSAAVAGSAGVGPNGEGREIVEGLLAELLPKVERARAIGDMVVSFWGALRRPVGVVATAGTGSVSFGRNEAGVARQVGGWGHLMGDEGSAYDIAVRALQAVARATDGRSGATQLVDALLRSAGVGSAIELALRVYSENLSRDRIAAFATEVVQVARAGDAVAIDILRAAGRELALAVVATARALELDRPAVSWAGSVFGAGDVILEPFTAAVHAALPGARLEPPAMPPLGGALRLALEACDAHASDELLDRWGEQLRGAL